jgi:hypothetical protein
MEILNHIIIYNVVFSLVSSYCFYSLCCMMSNVQMAMLHLNMNYICIKLFLCCALNPINTQKPPNKPQNTLDERKLLKKTINIDYYFPWIILNSWKSNIIINFCVWFTLVDFRCQFLTSHAIFNCCAYTKHMD